MDWIVASLIVGQLFWAGLMWFSQLTTYPLFGSVSAEQFGPLHNRYEKGLTFGVYLPFGLVILAVAAAVALRRDDIAPVWLWLSVAAGAGGIVTTAFCAAPLHIWLIRNGLDLVRVRWLLRWNAARTGFAPLGAVASIGILGM